MKLVSKLLFNPNNLQESPSTWGAFGYRNWWGGFHFITDRDAYWHLLVLIMRKPWAKAYWSLGSRYIWRRWIHRRCDTTDFNHDIYCPLDPWIKKRAREARYVEVWKGYYETKPVTCWHPDGYISFEKKEN